MTPETLTDDALVLRDVRGPTALGGGARRSLELLWLIATTEFKRTYFGTALGYLWSLCRPLLLFAVLLLVFTHIVRLGNAVPHYPVFLLLNIVLFGFFQEATNTSVGSVLSQEAVVRKTQFPRLVIPLAVVLTSLFNLVLNLIVVFVFLLAFGISPMWTWLLFPAIIVALFVLTTAVAMLLSALYPRFRDLGIIWAVCSTALLYATPVLYPLSHARGTVGELLALNPLALLFELTHKWVIQPNAPVEGGVVRIVVPILIFIAVCVLALWVFRREAPRIAEAL
ncbi:MAG TPA: ABC transporter permease [Solirubrobacteraceae bacterium]|jgi:ABC-2 type transport system permease protein